MNQARYALPKLMQLCICGMQMPEAARIRGEEGALWSVGWLASSSGMVAEMVLPECCRLESTLMCGSSDCSAAVKARSSLPLG
ncbi:MAG: hypothetical protein ACK5ES_00700 [Planctomyces sp.]